MRVLFTFLVLLAGCREQKLAATRDPTPPVEASPPLPQRKGVLLRTCAPWDGPALTWIVGENVTCAGPHPAARTQIVVYRDLANDGGVSGRWVFGTNVDNGHAELLAAGISAHALIGSVSLGAATEGVVSGEIDLVDGEAGRIHETLALTVCPGAQPCG